MNNTFAQNATLFFFGHHNFVCINCFSSNIETMLALSRNNSKKLQEKVEQIETTHKTFIRITEARQTKQQERIAQLEKIIEREEEKNSRIQNLYNIVSETYFDPLGIMSLYYITDAKNLPSILKRGILCKNKIIEENLAYCSFADEDIQLLRDHIPVGNGNGHDYVPLYFVPKPPMLYRLQKEYSKRSNQNELVYICIKKEILTQKGVFFTHRNLAAGNCLVFKDIKNLSVLDWEMIRSRNWGGNGERKHVKGAEVLIPRHVSPDWFTKIIVFDTAARNVINASQIINIPIEVNPTDYYY